MFNFLNAFSFFPLSSAQDAGLDALAAVISRQKIMGQEIGNELDEQNGKCAYVSLHIRQTNSRHITHCGVKDIRHAVLHCALPWNYLPNVPSWTVILSYTTIAVQTHTHAKLSFLKHLTSLPGQHDHVILHIYFHIISLTSLRMQLK